MAFPLLLFLLFANRYLISDFRSVGWSWVVPDGALGEALLIGVFTAFYPTRLDPRAVVHAAQRRVRRGGAHGRRVELAHPATAPAPAPRADRCSSGRAIAVGTNILAEVGLSFLGVGVQASTPSLGLAALDDLGDDLQPAHVRQPRLHALADDLPDGAIVLTVVSSTGCRRRSAGRLEPQDGAMRVGALSPPAAGARRPDAAADDRAHVRALLRDRASSRRSRSSSRTSARGPRRRSRSRPFDTSSTSTVEARPVRRLRRPTSRAATSARARRSTSNGDDRRDARSRAPYAPAARDAVDPHRRGRSRAAPLAAARRDLRQRDRLVGRPSHLVRRARPRLHSPDDARPDPAKRGRPSRLAPDERLLHVRASTADPPPGRSSARLRPCGGPASWATHLILPWLTFALLFLALYTRMIRASVAETIHEDFVRTARAKGASQTRSSPATFCRARAFASSRWSAWRSAPRSASASTSSPRSASAGSAAAVQELGGAASALDPARHAGDRRPDHADRRGRQPRRRRASTRCSIRASGSNTASSGRRASSAACSSRRRGTPGTPRRTRGSR